MNGQASVVVHGAATIVNALALGKGAAFGVDLWTKAQVKLTTEPMVIKGEIVSDPNENTLLIEKAAARVFRHFKVENQFGAIVKTTSVIPIARGLKSSSAAANATVLATAAALNKKLDDMTAINLAVDAAFDAKVTVTGAFDDACASYFGGVVVTDNLNRKLVKRFPFTGDLLVLFHVPHKKSYTIDSNVERLKTVTSLVQLAYREAFKGNFWTALSLNGIIYSAALGFDPSPALDALNAGSVAAGLCGKGPAITAVVPKTRVDQVKDALQKYRGDILQARLNEKKPRVELEQ
ncbi:MAG: shikimate kinase [Candidatus Bathyarchaeota archaeon]|nr:shikimate kinase [Candidatus Bathyarchaeota archaeon]